MKVSLVEMAALAGVAVRLLRSLVFTHGPTGNLLYLGGMAALGGAVLLGMLSLHLSNFTLRRWVWRAPLFGVIELR